LTVADIAGVHRVPPADVLDWNPEGLSDPSSFGRCRGPASECNGLGAVERHDGLFREIFDGHLVLVEQDIDSGYSRGHDGGFDITDLGTGVARVSVVILKGGWGGEQAPPVVYGVLQGRFSDGDCCKSCHLP